LEAEKLKGLWQQDTTRNLTESNPHEKERFRITKAGKADLEKYLNDHHITFEKRPEGFKKYKSANVDRTP